MQDVFDYLKVLEVNFLATRNGTGVSCRPFGDPITLNNPSFKCYYLSHATAEVRDNDGKVLASYEF